MAEQPLNTKKIAAEKAVEYVENGMCIGLGTGSTAYWAIQAIGKLVEQGLKVTAVATSKESERMAIELGIQIVPFSQVDQLDLTIDGADETDENLNVIKGGGGALVREKIVAAASRIYIIIADEKKLVAQLGAFPLPVEIVQFGWEMTMRHLQKLGCKTSLRSKNGSTFISDNGNYIVDCSFGKIPNPELTHQQINLIPGVVENGLFLKMADLVILGQSDGSTKILPKIIISEI